MKKKINKILKPLDWNFKKYGFKIINWDFPKDDVPHCEVVLKINTGLIKLNEDTYSLSGPLPFDTGIEILENLKKSIGLAIKEIKQKTK
jgi:hypothetical protein